MKLGTFCAPAEVAQRDHILFLLSFRQHSSLVSSFSLLENIATIKVVVNVLFI